MNILFIYLLIGIITKNKQIYLIFSFLFTNIRVSMFLLKALFDHQVSCRDIMNPAVTATVA